MKTTWIKQLWLVVLIIGYLSMACGSKGSNTGSDGSVSDSQTQNDGHSSSDSTVSQSGNLIKSDKKRISSPTVDQNDFAAQMKGDHDFSFALYQQLKAEDGNLFFSPLSITQALAMLYAGARGNTETQIASTLHFVLPQDKLHPVYNALDLELKSRGQNAQAADGKGFRLNVVNAIWGQEGYSFQTPFLDTLALHYGAGLHTLDFLTKAEPSRLLINQWVEDQTEDRIKDLLPQGSINDSTRLVLTNAIYFNAAWGEAFETNKTANGTFHRLDGTTVTVPLMSQSVEHGFVDVGDYTALKKPYDGGELSMWIIVPDSGKFAAVEQSLNSALLDDVSQKSSSYLVNLKMPKFEFDADFALNKTLVDLGMIDAFSSSADFSGIDGTKNLSVSGVLHKAFIKVNEAGTEAAAATAVIVGATSVPPVADLTIDRPFIFLIQDHKTKSILFLGRVVDPS